MEDGPGRYRHLGLRSDYPFEDVWSRLRVPQFGQTAELRANHPELLNRVRQKPQVSSQREARIAQWNEVQESVRTGLIASIWSWLTLFLTVSCW